MVQCWFYFLWVEGVVRGGEYCYVEADHEFEMEFGGWN